VVSHVVFQHIPDPEITLGYVREIGRVLRSGGWAAFHISNDPQVHVPETRGARLRRLVGRGLPWHDQPHWRGSHIEISALRGAAAEGSLEVEHVVGEGTQYCVVRLRRA
jgi:SAM-dependent methyltransferase